MSVISVNNLTKKYINGDCEVPIFHNISFDIEQHEKIAIVGPSGCGKSTLLNMLSGLDLNYEGDIVVSGDNIGNMPIKDLMKKRLNDFGYIFQDFQLVDTLTVLDNILVPSWAAKEKVDMQEIEEICELLDIWKRRDYYPTVLSGGEKQRCAIVRALINKPEIIFCDEATGNLDEENTVKVMDYLNDLCNRYGSTWVFVTHDLALTKYADRIFYLEKEGIRTE